MPAIIKIVINIKLIVIFLLLLQQTNGLRNQSVKHASRSHDSKLVPGIARDSIIMKWMNTEAALRKAYINLIKSLLPTAYGMSLISNVSQNCTYSLLQYFNGLRNMKTWAFKMLDSTGTIPNGIVSGTPMAFGDFDTCLEIESPSRKFRGQYCYIDISLPLPEREVMTPIELPVDELHEIFEPDTVSDHLVKLARFLYNSQLRLTTCLPSTCSKADVNTLFSNAMVYLKTGTQVQVLNCEIKEDPKYSAMEIFIFVIFSFLIGLVVSGTCVDILLRINPRRDFETSEKNTTIKALLCFSAYTNYIRLLKIDNNPDTLHIFHGLRVISMCWIIWSHSYLVVNYRAFDSGFYSMDIGKSLIFQTVPCGFLAVENFFFMSSVLLSYVCVRMRGRINVPLIFMKRYLRLTPTMMLVSAFFGIIGRFGTGPVWKETVTNTLSKNCLERGWINLFYLNNYLYSSKTCLGWTWYLSTDTQMFLLTLYLCVILRRRPGRGLLLTGLVLIGGVLLSAVSHVYYKLPPTYLQSYLNFEDWYYYATKGYTQIHFHLPVCAAGLVVGYILATKRGKIPKHINALGWLLSALTLLTMVGLTYKWNQGLEAIPNMFISTLYGSTHRLAWALCLAFMTLSCTWGQGGIVNSILCWEGFVPFARLTYMVYLLHYGLMYVYTATVRQTLSYNHRALSFIFFNNLIVSFAAAFVLGLFFESPLMAMENAFSDGKLKKQVQPVNVANKTIILKNAA